MNGTEIMNHDIKSKRIRLCAACGEVHGLEDKAPRCRICKGQLVTMGPIEWTEEDEAFEALEQAAIDIDILEDKDPEDEFQDIVCYLWDMIEEGEDQIIDQADEVEEAKKKVEALNGVVDEKNAEIEELKAKLADETLTGKVKKAFGTE